MRSVSTWTSAIASLPDGSGADTPGDETADATGPDRMATLSTDCVAGRSLETAVGR
jgi:hypothetical protein